MSLYIHNVITIQSHETFIFFSGTDVIRFKSDLTSSKLFIFSENMLCFKLLFSASENAFFSSSSSYFFPETEILMSSCFHQSYFHVFEFIFPLSFRLNISLPSHLFKLFPIIFTIYTSENNNRNDRDHPCFNINRMLLEYFIYCCSVHSLYLNMNDFSSKLYAAIYTIKQIVMKHLPAAFSYKTLRNSPNVSFMYKIIKTELHT